MSDGHHPELSFSYRNLKLTAKGAAAIQAVRLALSALLISLSICLVIVALRISPVETARGLIEFFSR
jgi:hypothetical protein